MTQTGHVRTISTDRAPAPAGHYAQATIAGDQLYIAGQLPIWADGTPLPDLRFETQARQAIGNMLAVLDAAGATPAQLARVTAYIVGVEQWRRFDAVFAEMLGNARPARTVVPVSELHHGFLVEIDAIALVARPA
ncbi:MAG: RidA family protein [Sphingomonas sp.]